MTTITLALRKRWWFAGALVIGIIFLRMGLIRDRPNPKYVDGTEPAFDRVAKWLAENAIVAVVEQPRGWVKL